MLDLLEAGARGRLGEGGYVRIDGGVGLGEREARVGAFQREPGRRVALLGATAAGTGLTLTAASTVLFAELLWTPGQLLQARTPARPSSAPGPLLQARTPARPAAAGPLDWRRRAARTRT